MHTKRGRIAAIGFSLFGILFIASLALSSASPAVAGVQSPGKQSSVAYHDTWRELWEDHITWTRVVIMAILDDLPGTDVYVGRLLQNVGDMGAALRPYYGDEADELGVLIQDHLVIAAELLVAARDGDATGFEDARVRWYENAEQNAVQMNQMNPQFWPLEATHHMWVEHLDATLAEAVGNLSGDYAGEVAAYDQIHQLALEMADFMSAGVIRQFPGRFNGGVPR